MRPLTADFRQSAVSWSSKLQRAIRDEDFEMIPDLLECAHSDSSLQNKNVWKESNARGWTAMHFAACSHSSSSYWWHWILSQQQQKETRKDSTIFERCSINNHWLYSERNDMGYSCIDLFLKHSLQPFSWQRPRIHQKSKILLQSMKQVCANPILAAKVRNKIIMSNAEFPPKDLGHDPLYRRHVIATSSSSEEINDPTMIVDCVATFWIHWLCLLQVAFPNVNCCVKGSNKDAFTYNTNDGNEQGTYTNILYILARLTWCPGIVAQLGVIIAGGPSKIYNNIPCLSPIQQNDHPLHFWAYTDTSRLRRQSIEIEPDILEVILQSNPQAALICSSHVQPGRLPLHIALLRGKSWEEVEPLWNANPDALLVLDPITGYPPWILPFIAEESIVYSEENLKFVAKQHLLQGSSATGSWWSYLPKRMQQKALKEARVILEAEVVETMYETLRRCPNMVSSLTLLHNK